ncbi:CPBP family intramembrane glutamic endopeptidase [Hazenella coriacea]|uniref:CAAX prenyl protease-like protein n=1 Tax=Hazenella coriacea TaxID=1179467 RepID=A0A4R3L8Q0_9BACL|nr:CPBP family intramembrane glutamic endopeptidase [Hazenella coriacea]TCS95435.1 CAAX prenyl protease-like protein [Hazenella coriacea]
MKVNISWVHLWDGMKKVHFIRNGIAWVMCVCFFAMLPLEYASLQWIETDEGMWQIFRQDQFSSLGFALVSFIRILVILVGSFIFLLLGIYDRFQFERNRSLNQITLLDLVYYTAWIQTGVMVGSIPFLWMDGEVEWINDLLPYLPHVWLVVLGVILFHRSFSQIGLRSINMMKWIQILLISVVLYGWVTFFLDSWITKPVADFFHIELMSWREETINQGIDVATVRGPLFLFFQWLMIGLIGVFAEEFFFRGMIYEAIANDTGKWMGVLFSSSLFALFHVDIALLAPLFVLGLILGGLKVYFKSLWAPIIFHVLNNSMSVWIQIFDW